MPILRLGLSVFKNITGEIKPYILLIWGTPSAKNWGNSTTGNWG